MASYVVERMYLMAMGGGYFSIYGLVWMEGLSVIIIIIIINYFTHFTVASSKWLKTVVFTD